MNLQRYTSVRHVFSAFLCLAFVFGDVADDDISYSTADQKPTFGEAKAPRYLLYDVNPGEGFNLRRDVYMRISNLVKFLNEDEPWILVLPPWGRLYHWQSRDVGSQIKIPWSRFFDISSLKRHIPVMEFEEYLTVRGEPMIDEVYYLQRYAEGWGGKFEEKIDFRDCIERTGFTQDDGGKWRSWFFGYEKDVYANKFQCLSAQGHASIMKNFLMKNTTARAVMLPRGETLLHDNYGQKIYWEARRSMMYAKHLKEIGDEFRKEFLQSNDVDDKTQFGDDWTKEEKQHGDAIGGPFIGVHLRRKDFINAHKQHVASLKTAASQVRKLLEKFELEKVFLATDAPSEEIEKFKKHLKEYEVYNFVASEKVKQKYQDGGVSIIDQWICAHARYFIGTHSSTFSFRIHEDREILGFDPETTFNRLCTQKELETECEDESKWKITYEEGWHF